MAPSGHAVHTYKDYKFQVKLDGRYVAGVTRISALKRTTEVVRHSSGNTAGPPDKTPGRTEFDAVTLERGLTQDREFETWAATVWDPHRGLPAADFRKNLTIELHDDTGKVVLAYNLFRCWVSEYQALPELSASSNSVAIESIRIEHEGWERDQTIPGP